jgi:hypothetical protein
MPTSPLRPCDVERDLRVAGEGRLVRDIAEHIARRVGETQPLRQEPLQPTPQ